MKPSSCFITLSLLVIVNIISAQHVNIQTAEQIAQNFYLEQHNIFEGTINRNDIQIKESFIETQDGKEVLYIFNISSGGFVIIPTEKAIEPVLGYSFEGEYNPDISDSNFSAWFQMYKNKISNLKENRIKADNELNSKWEEILQQTYKYKGEPKDVDPLTSAIWNQDFPYNIYCPEDPPGIGGYCYVGPIAVAMGQIMYYWRYPISGTSNLSYYHPEYGTIYANFEETFYEWTGMADVIDYNNPIPIAQLLYHCAVSVETDFGPNGSGAYSSDVDDAFRNYFGYDESCQYKQRQGTPLSTWLIWLKGELDNFRPVYYAGSTPPPYSGHAFVVDGYHESGGDFFHINFGWSGYNNGWYTITDAGGFTQNQAMVINIFPESGYPYYCQESDTVTSFSGTIDDGSGNTYNYENNTNCDWLIAPQSENDSISGLILNFSSFQTEAGNDIVTIYDGPTNAYPTLGLFSGSELPSQIVPSGNTALINFTTNGSITESGWFLNFASQYPTYCSGVQTFTNISDTITDGSGPFYYRNSTTCMWHIEPPGASEVTLYFTAFETEENKDIVAIYDASNNQLLAEYSGIYSPGNPPPSVTSPSGEMFITFQSDLINNEQGWEGVYVLEGWYPPPTALTITDSIYQLNISWTMPDTSNLGLSFLGYNLYKDGILLNANLITDTFLIDGVGPGDFEYCVTAVYEEGESEPVCESIIIPCYGTLELNLTDTISGQGIAGIEVNIGDTTIISGLNGSFEIMLPEGNYTITINTPGYDPVYSSCDILCEQTTTVELILTAIFPPPQNVNAEIIDVNVVYCSWDSADTIGVVYNLLGYNIYRNDTLLNDNIIVGTFYYDLSFYLANQEYCITSVYEVSESEKICDVVEIETGGITGNVYNIYTSISVPGAVVNLGIYSDTTDILGNFSMDEIPIGSYEIDVTAENYYPMPPGTTVDIVEGIITNVIIPLSPLYLYPPLLLQYEILNPGEGVKLFWNPPLPHPWILEGYNVYLREWGVGDFEIINDELVTDTLFIDSNAGGCSNNEYYITAEYNAGESQGSNIVFVVIPGLTQINEINIEIYPNPAKDKLYIDIPESINNQCILNLYKSNGENCLSKTFIPEQDNLINLDLQNLESGVYLLNIQAHDIIVARKIIVQ